MASKPPAGGTRTLGVPDARRTAVGAAGRSVAAGLPWRRLGLMGAACAMLLIFAVVLAHGGSGKASKSAAAGQHSAVPVTSPRGHDSTASHQNPGRSGVPVGYPQTKPGAIAAAVNFEMGRSVASYVTDTDYRHRLLTAVMSSGSLKSQTAQDDQLASQITKNLNLTSVTASSLIMRGAPLGTDVTSYSSQVATVSVWMSEIVGVPTAESPLPVSASWTTYTFTLQWQAGDWKIAAIESVDGPTPLQTNDGSPSSVDTFATMDGEFDAPPYVS
jgi:hypothetical protein